MESLGQNIAKAWQLRIDLQLEDCLGVITELKQSLGIPNGHLRPEQVQSLFSTTEPRMAADLLLLFASLARVYGDPQYADQLLALIDSELKALGIHDHYRVAYENGRSHFMAGEYSLALEEFLSARVRSGSDLERLWACSNILFCMENLAIPYEKMLAEVNGLVEKLKNEHDLRKVITQMQAFRQRELFHRGKIDELKSEERKRSKSSFDQSQYFRLWLGQLPYHSLFDKDRSDELARLSMESSFLDHKSYRLRTLQGMLHPSDYMIVKPSEWVDRLYLWVWRWLTSPGRFPLERVIALLKELDIEKVSHRLTAEDSQLLRNALLWLGLFDRSSERAVRPLLIKIKMHGCNFPLLELEALVVDYFTALRNGNDLLGRDTTQLLKAHALWKAKCLHFRSLAEAVSKGNTAVPSQLQPLVEMLKLTLCKDEAVAGSVTIDLNRNVITEDAGKTKVVSEPLCAAFELLKSQPCVSCEEFARVVFGLHTFDSLIHQPKIFNLLARMKSITKNQPRFGVKSGNVIAQGQWKHIVFKKTDIGPLGIEFVKGWTPFRSGSHNGDTIGVRRNPRAISPEKIDWKNGLTRRELEDQLGIPRSSMNRILAKWLRSSVISRRGLSSNTYYVFNPAAKARSEKGTTTP